MAAAVPEEAHDQHRQAFFSLRPSEVEIAVNNCLSKIPELKEEGGVHSAWLCMSINAWGFEQERLLLMTDKAYYRVKYNFIQRSLLHHDRSALADIVKIQHGYFTFPKWSLTPYISSFDLTKLYGIRIFKDDVQSLGWFGIFKSNDAMPFRTFRAHAPLHATDTKERCGDFLMTMIETRRAMTNAKKFQEVAAPIELESYLSLPATVYNESALGSFKQRGDFAFGL